LPKELYTSIDFYIQRVRPHLFYKHPAEATNKSFAFWLDHDGEAMEHNHFTENLWQIYNKFNPHLNLTPINFRHRVVTAIFASYVICSTNLLSQSLVT
jgi:hypothetical protein